MIIYPPVTLYKDLNKALNCITLHYNYISKNHDQKYPLQITDKDICIGINF